MLEAESISFSIGNNQILRELSIRIESGQIMVLVGPSGAGKTSLLRCLALLAYPSTGRISMEARVFNFPSEHKIHPPWPDITAVFQQHFLWPHLTLRENILLPLQLNDRLDNDRVDELIEKLRLGPFIDRFPSHASLGQRQRAAIARALALNPAYVLLDEITSALDVEQSYAILEHLFELKQRNIGILLITHQLNFAKAILERNSSDRVAFIDEGEIIEIGGAELLGSPQHPRVRGFVEKMEFRLHDHESFHKAS
jgi:ABC-type polar amino acid transport system ATPase subunit